MTNTTTPKKRKGNPTPICVDGMEFKSRADAAEYFQIRPDIFVTRIHRGWTPEQAAELVPYEAKKQGTPIEIENKLFESYEAAANYYGVKYRTFSNRLNKGWTKEQAAGIEPRTRSKFIDDKITIEGVSYPSISAAAKKYGISKQLFHLRLKQGLSLEECAGIQNPKGLTIEGKFFKNKSEAAEYYGIKPNTFTVRLRRGYTIEEALELTSRD